MEAEAGSEVFFIAYHHVDVLRNFTIDLATALQASELLPQRGAVVEVVRSNRAMLFGALERLDDDVGCCRRESRKNAPRVEPACAMLAENVFPVDVASLELARRRVATVNTANCAAHTEAALGEVEAVTNRASKAVVRVPLDVIGIDAALHNKVFKQVANFVVHEGRDHRTAQSKALAHATRHVVLAAALPDVEVTRRTHATVTRIEPQHDLAETDNVVVAGLC